LSIEVATNVPGNYQTFGSAGSSVTLDKVVAESQITIQDLRNSEENRSQKEVSDRLFSYATLERNLKAAKFVITSVRGKSRQVLPGETSPPQSSSIISSSTSNIVTTTTAQIAAPNCGIWRPNFHSNLSAASSFAGQRYNTLKFAFTQGQLDQFACTDSTGFEPDFITYNYDNAYYFESIVLSFSTNMPYSYLDTSFDDDPGERVYTVGTSKASALKPWIEYNTYFRTGNGNANSDLGKIVWQRNSERVAGCSIIFGPAWCLFVDDYVKIYPFEIPIPGYFEG
jgi:hypothetical protein